MFRTTLKTSARKITLEIPEEWVGRDLIVTIRPHADAPEAPSADREAVAAFFARHRTTLGKDWKLDRGELHERNADY